MTALRLDDGSGRRRGPAAARPSFGDIPLSDYLAITGKRDRSAGLLAEALRRTLIAERRARFWRRTAIVFACAWFAGWLLLETSR